MKILKSTLPYIASHDFKMCNARKNILKIMVRCTDIGLFVQLWERTYYK